MMRHSAFRIPNSAFTLVELMISMVLVLLLILGINRVFQMTSDAVGAGAAQSDIVRGNRAAQASINNDFRVAVSPQASNKPNGDAPFFIIRSQREPAFRNQQDALSDLDYNPTETGPAAVDDMIRSRDLNADNNEDLGDPAETPSPAIYDFRNHRVDRIGFFARDLFTRQTGGTIATQGAAPYIAPMSSTEAYIWYGHLQQPDFGDEVPTSPRLYNHRSPGIELFNAYDGFNDPRTIQDNPRNFYASQWILGRVVLLLVTPEDTDGDGVGDEILDRNDVEQLFIQRRPIIAASGPGNPQNSLAPLNTGSLSNETAPQDQWWINWARYDLAGTSFTDYKTIIEYYIADWPNPASEMAWWDTLSDFRFQGNSYPLKPFTPSSLARTVPNFLPACTQFIVEYAGNFVAQDTDGNVTMDWRDPSFVDTETDFVIETVGTQEIRRTRWYGLPRNINTSDDGAFPVIQGTGDAEDMLDVVPLSDVLDSAGLLPAPFERDIPDQRGNYADPDDPMVPNMPYTVAWGPDTIADPMPTMLRITLAIDDPNGRIGEAQTYEYVIQLP